MYGAVVTEGRVGEHGAHAAGHQRESPRRGGRRGFLPRAGGEHNPPCARCRGQPAWPSGRTGPNDLGFELCSWLCLETNAESCCARRLRSACTSLESLGQDDRRTRTLRLDAQLGSTAGYTAWLHNIVDTNGCVASGTRARSNGLRVRLKIDVHEITYNIDM